MDVFFGIFSELARGGGGIETWTGYFSEELYNMYPSWNVKYFYLKSKTNDNYKNNKRFIPVDCGEIKKGSGKNNMIIFNFKIIKNIIKQRPKSKFNFVSVGGFYLSPASIFLKIYFRKKMNLCVWIRSITYGEMKAVGSKFFKLAYYMEKFLLRFSDIVIFNGSDTFKYYTNNNKELIDKSTVIFNALAEEKYISLKKISYDDSPSLRVSFMGRYSKAKGIHDFNEISKKYNERYHESTKHRKVIFNSYGFGDYKLNESIVDHGKYTADNIAEKFLQNDIILFLNNSGFAGGVSHSLLEAMSSGRLILAWDNSIHNQVLNNNNSILIEDGNIISFVEKIRYLSSLDKIEFNKLVTEKVNNCRKDIKLYSTKNHTKKFAEEILRLN